jgi:hypothetical protein
LGGTAALLSVLGVTLFLVFRQDPSLATVTAVEWTQQIVVERYQLKPQEGFAPPSDAEQVVRTGERVLRVDTVPDGMRSETYTDREACGKTCSRTSRTCTRDKNGFRSCVGGNQICTTQYCDRQKTRQVPKTKDVPVVRPYFSWKAWGWTQHRVVTHAGQDSSVTWPSAEEVALNQGCGPGESERESREARYRVVFRGPDGKYVDYLPTSADEFSRLEVGTQKKLDTDEGGQTVLDE